MRGGDCIEADARASRLSVAGSCILQQPHFVALQRQGYLSPDSAASIAAAASGLMPFWPGSRPWLYRCSSSAFTKRPLILRGAWRFGGSAQL